jgi:hypothetical protein
MKPVVTLAAALAAALLSAAALGAQGVSASGKLELQGAYYPPNTEALGTTGFAPVDVTVFPGGDPSVTGLRTLGTGWGGAEAKAILSEEIVIPFLRGEGALFSGNNVALRFSGELSPVSLNAVAQATLTPIALLKLAAGAAAGTGWSVGFVGLALNPASNFLPLQEIPFGGMVWRTWVSGTLQFDLAAVLPGEWNHLVAVASPMLEYRANTAAADGVAWMWEADKGYDFNGLKLKGTFFLGYQMPLSLNTVGFLLETEAWLPPVSAYSPAPGGWGSDFVWLNFGPVFNFTLGERSALAVLVQFKTAPKWTDTSAQNRYFGTRDFDSPYLYFNRVALSYTLGL